MKLRILEICKAAGLTQKELAEKIGLSPVGLSKSINGNPTKDTLEKIAAALNVKITQLFEDNDHSFTCPSCGARIRVEKESGLPK